MQTKSGRSVVFGLVLTGIFFAGLSSLSHWYERGHGGSGGDDLLHDDIRCSNFAALNIIDRVNDAAGYGGLGKNTKILSFISDFTAYYGRFTSVSYRDPYAAAVLSAKSLNEAMTAVRAAGITHVIANENTLGSLLISGLGQYLQSKMTHTMIAVDDYRLIELAPSNLLKKPHLSAPGESLTIKLDQLQSGFTTRTDRHVSPYCSSQFSIARIKSERVVSVRGEAQILYDSPIEIDPTLKYRVSVKLRTLAESNAAKQEEAGGRGAQTDVGLATYNSHLSLETESPGTHRYGVVGGKFISEAAGWKIYEGIFDGQGNQSSNQFRVATRYVSPVIVTDERNVGYITEIEYIKIEVLRKS